MSDACRTILHCLISSSFDCLAPPASLYTACNTHTCPAYEKSRALRILSSPTGVAVQLRFVCLVVERGKKDWGIGVREEDHLAVLAHSANRSTTRTVTIPHNPLPPPPSTYVQNTQNQPIRCIVCGVAGRQRYLANIAISRCRSGKGDPR